jgi:anti-anti-sigma regulatory factor
VKIAQDALQLELPSQAERQSTFGQPFLHTWVGGVAAREIVIDCGRLEHVNSVLIAWMLQIVQSSKPTPVRIVRAKPQVSTQLKQLRLDHLMAIS